MTNLVSVKQISNKNLDKMKTEYAILVSVVAVIVLAGLFYLKKEVQSEQRPPLSSSTYYNFGRSPQVRGRQSALNPLRSNRFSGLPGPFKKQEAFRYSYNDPLARERSASEIERDYV